MGIVLLKCSVTQKVYPTRIQIDQGTFSDLAGDLLGSSYCPYCRVQHVWRTSQAMYVDALPMPIERKKRPSQATQQISLYLTNLSIR
jgi:hypothetical protein